MYIITHVNSTFRPTCILLYIENCKLHVRVYCYTCRLHVYYYTCTLVHQFIQENNSSY